MKPTNQIKITLPSLSANEGFARVAVGAFVAQLDPTVDELADIKTAVSEAVTNCAVHAYADAIGMIYISAEYYPDRTVKIKIKDKGCGIDNIEQAMQPMWSSVGGERAGLGFAVMQSFTDGVKVRSALGKGTTVTLTKALSQRVHI